MSKEKWQAIIKKSVRLTLLAAVVFVILYLWEGKNFFQGQRESDSRYLSLFSDVVGLVKNHYVEEKDPEIVLNGAFRALVSGLDSYSSYLDSSQSRLYRFYQRGELFTLGLSGMRRDHRFLITDVSPRSPADEAGLKAGDTILAVNGKSLYDLTYWEMALSVVSVASQKLALMVEEPGSSQARPFSLVTRSGILKNRTVMLEKRIRLIELKRFDRLGAALIRNVLERSDSGSGTIVDLRMYMGGNFESFVEITKLLVNRQVAVTLQTRDGGSPFIAGSPDSAMAGQCVYIINGSTILYGELLAHLLKNAGARLVGQRTTGFTPRLNQVELGNGDSVLITEGVFNIEGQSTLGSGVDPSFHMETDNSALLYAKCIALILEKG